MPARLRLAMGRFLSHLKRRADSLAWLYYWPFDFCTNIKNLAYFQFFWAFWKRVATFYIKADGQLLAWLSRSWFQEAFFRQLRRGHYLSPFCDPKLALKINPNEPSKRIKNKPKIIHQIIHQNGIIETRHKKAKQGTKTAIYFY